jgi:hypothetical protein
MNRLLHPMDTAAEAHFRCRAMRIVGSKLRPTKNT